jgi:hypothetical protein
VPCGGVALLQASSAVSISDNGASVDGSDDERTGARIVLRALEEPLRQLAENAGLERRNLPSKRKPSLWVKDGKRLRSLLETETDVADGAADARLRHAEPVRRSKSQRWICVFTQGRRLRWHLLVPDRSDRQQQLGLPSAAGHNTAILKGTLKAATAGAVKASE